MRIEHEYERGGAWAYLAALDVHRAKMFGRCEGTTGIAPFERLVEKVMSQAPYNTARRVFWVMDNGSSHCGEASEAVSYKPTSAWFRSTADPCQLAQPDRDLRLDRAAQCADSERLPLLGGGRRQAGKLRALLREHRAPV
jgi:hypothetical protein